MKIKKGGIVDRLGKGYSPNLDEVLREATDPRGGKMRPLPTWWRIQPDIAWGRH